MAGDDPGLLVVPGGVPSELEDLRGEVLHDGSEVDGAAKAAGLPVLAFLQVAPHAHYGELKASPGRCSPIWLLDFASLTAARHRWRLRKEGFCTIGNKGWSTGW